MSNESEKIIKLTGLQKAMARRMVASWTDVPQFQLETEIDCEPMISFRKSRSFKLSYTAIYVKAIAKTLEEFPLLNSSWAGDHIVEHEEINIGVAADTARGLLVPVIRNANRKSFEEIMQEMEVIKEKGKRGNFKMEELEGGTFTLSNLGMYRITSFGSIVNAPESGILAIGTMQKVAIVKEDNTLGIATKMRPVLSVDHRVADGATGAKFLNSLVEKMEDPSTFLK